MMAADSRVHPATTETDASPPPPLFSFAASPPKGSTEHPMPKIPQPASEQVPPPKTYVVQFPRDEILRHPPTGNEKKFKNLTRRKSRHGCCFYTICLLILLIIIVFVSAGVVYLVFRFKSPHYTVTHVAIRGMNLTSPAPMSPEFDVTIRVENPNEKINIYYRNEIDVSVSYRDWKLSDGVLPAFSQTKKNVMVLQTTLTGYDIVLGRDVWSSLVKSESEETVPFVVKVSAPVKIKVGSMKTWEFTIKVKCDIVVDALNERANVVLEDCDYRLRFW